MKENVEAGKTAERDKIRVTQPLDQKPLTFQLCGPAWLQLIQEPISNPT